MATSDKPRRKAPKPTSCDECNALKLELDPEFNRIDHDPVTNKNLCNNCWAAVDPAKFGHRRP